jgi:hypothetical protein
MIQPPSLEPLLGMKDSNEYFHFPLYVIFHFCMFVTVSSNWKKPRILILERRIFMPETVLGIMELEVIIPIHVMLYVLPSISFHTISSVVLVCGEGKGACPIILANSCIF